MGEDLRVHIAPVGYDFVRVTEPLIKSKADKAYFILHVSDRGQSKFLEHIKQNNEIQVTSPKMTRFNISMDNAIALIFKALEITKGSEVFIPKIHSYILSDLIDALTNVTQKNFKIKKIPIRNGEKIHETLLNKFEIPYSIESNNMYILLPPEKISQKKLIKKNYTNEKPLKFNVYSSEFADKMSQSELETLIKNYILMKK